MSGSACATLLHLRTSAPSTYIPSKNSPEATVKTGDVREIVTTISSHGLPGKCILRKPIARRRSGHPRVPSASNSPLTPLLAMKTLLITDDDPAVLALTALVLQKSSYRCLKATSAAQALQILSSLPEVDALVTDILMPGMTGIELGNVVRRDKPDLPILLISGFRGSDKDDPLGLLRQPGIAFLPKPFTPVQLLTAVDALLSR